MMSEALAPSVTLAFAALEVAYVVASVGLYREESRAVKAYEDALLDPENADSIHYLAACVEAARARRVRAWLWPFDRLRETRPFVALDRLNRKMQEKRARSERVEALLREARKTQGEA